MFSANQNKSISCSFEISVNRCIADNGDCTLNSSWYTLSKVLWTRISPFHYLQAKSVIIICLSFSQMGDTFVFLTLFSEGAAYLFLCTSYFELRPFSSLLSTLFSEDLFPTVFSFITGLQADFSDSVYPSCAYWKSWDTEISVSVWLSFPSIHLQN